MKVLHISTSDIGGAAIAAIRLHKGLLEKGIASKFLCLKNNSNFFPNKYIIDKPPLSLHKRVLNRLNFPQTNQQKHDNELRKRSGYYEAFSTPLTDYDLLSNRLVQEADIIHLHWVSNFLDWPNFFPNIRKPVIWTLHDMNPFQGGFHYYNDVKENKITFGDIENRYRAIKKEAILKVKRLDIVAPSVWLTRMSQESELLGNFPHCKIPNGLDTSIFRPLDQDFCRAVLGLPREKKVILFVAQSIDNERKGFNLLIEALEKLKDKDVVLAILGHTSSLIRERLSTNIYEIGQIKNERFLPIAYSAADLFVIPSLEDNLPNTVIESLSCGTPVVGFQIGGIPDMIKEGENGLLCNDININKLAATIDKALLNKFDRESIRKDAVERFDQSLQAEKYIELYNASVNNK